MIILTIKTSHPKAEIGIYKDNKQLEYLTWEAHLELTKTIHLKIKEISAAADISLSELDGVVVFSGPGSFTGLRIGVSVAKALAYSWSIPIVGAQDAGWIDVGIVKLLAGKNETNLTPLYGRVANTTKPRK
jgi:tRNA threonylcarbamoyladenosine biosynthesis protein TsaB